MNILKTFFGGIPRSLIAISLASISYKSLAQNENKGKSSGFHVLKVKVFCDKLSRNDTLQIHFFKNSFPNSDPLPPDRDWATFANDGSFTFNIPVNSSYGHFQIVKKLTEKNLDKRLSKSAKSLIDLGFMALTPLFYWEYKDDLSITISEVKDKNVRADILLYDELRYKYHFKGPGARKYAVRLLCDSAADQIPLSLNKNDGIHFRDWKEPQKRNALKELDKFKNQLTISAYSILKADILFDDQTVRGFLMTNNIFQYVRKQLTDTIRLHSQVDFSYFDSVLYRNNIPAIYLSRSLNAADYVINFLRVKYDILNNAEVVLGRNPNIDSIYYQIKNNFSGIFRDKILLTLFLKYKMPLNSTQIYEDALNIVQTPEYALELNNVMGATRPGAVAYNFSLPDSDNVLHSLSDLKGKIVFVDFWFTGCGSCIALYKTQLHDVEEYFNKNDSVKFVTISTDKSKSIWITGLRSGQYTGPHSLNLFTEGKGIDHAIIKYYRPDGFPAVMLIDQFGKVIMYNGIELYKKESLIDLIDTALKQTVK